MQWKQTFCALRRICLDILFPTPFDVHAFENISGDRLLNEALRAPYDHILQNLNAEAVFSYRDPLIRNIIRAFKYTGQKELSLPLGYALYDTVHEDMAYGALMHDASPVILIPIPLSRARLRERTFNQSALIARELWALLPSGSATLTEDALVRVRDTEKQALRMSRAEREENVRGCFAVTDSSRVAGKRVLLIDDVITTGATMREARHVLLDAGAQSVRCL